MRRGAATGDTTSTRAALVARLQDHLQRTSMPRLIVLTIVVGAGLVAFVVSALTLRMGVESMAARYFLASLCGYLGFIGFIRTWIAVRRRETSHLANLLDEATTETGGQAVEAVIRSAARTPGAVARSPFQGGASGGAGSSGGWRPTSGGPVEADVRIPAGGPRSFSIGLDLDDAWWLVTAAVLVLAGGVAIAYVVYAAPILLAEVALDAAIVSTIYRRLRRHEAGHWLAAVWRRTWLPALLVVLFASGAGFAIQAVLPDARSIGDLIRVLAA